MNVISQTDRFQSLSEFINLPHVLESIRSEMSVYKDGREKKIPDLVDEFAYNYKTHKDLRNLLNSIVELSPYPCPNRGRILKTIHNLASDIRDYCCLLSHSRIKPGADLEKDGIVEKS